MTVPSASVIRTVNGSGSVIERICPNGMWCVPPAAGASTNAPAVTSASA
jgi:hypothetical protein